MRLGNLWINFGRGGVVLTNQPHWRYKGTPPPAVLEKKELCEMEFGKCLMYSLFSCAAS